MRWIVDLVVEFVDIPLCALIIKHAAAGDKRESSSERVEVTPESKNEDQITFR